MPYSKEHKNRTRQKILQAAGRLFQAKGFDATSIEAVMQACGLTRGGFYAHFTSKAHLYREALANTAPAAQLPASGAGACEDDWLDALLQASLRELDATDPDSEGPWAFLATDVASTQREVRHAYSHAVKRMGERLQVDLGKAAHDNATGLVTLAMLVGAMAIAKTVDDQRLKTTLIEACRNAAQDLRQDDTVITRPVFFWTPDATQAAVCS